MEDYEIEAIAKELAETLNKKAISESDSHLSTIPSSLPPVAEEINIKGNIKLHIVPQPGYVGLVDSVILLRNQGEENIVGYKFVVKRGILFFSKKEIYPKPRTSFYYPEQILNYSPEVFNNRMKSSDPIHIYVLGDDYGVETSKLMLPKDLIHVRKLLEYAKYLRSENLSLKAVLKKVRGDVFKAYNESYATGAYHIKAVEKLKPRVYSEYTPYFSLRAPEIGEATPPPSQEQESEFDNLVKEFSKI